MDFEFAKAAVELQQQMKELPEEDLKLNMTITINQPTVSIPWTGCGIDPGPTSVLPSSPYTVSDNVVRM